MWRWRWGGEAERQRRAGDSGALEFAVQCSRSELVDWFRTVSSRCRGVDELSQQNWKGLVGPSVLVLNGPPQPVPAVHHRLFHNFIHVSEHLFHINSINYEMLPPRCKPADAHYQFPRLEHSDPHDLEIEDQRHSSSS